MADSMEQQFAYERQLQQDKMAGDTTLNAPHMLDAQREAALGLITQLNPQQVITMMKLLLQGKREEFDAEGNKEIVAEGEPLMNDAGIGKMIILMSSIINASTVMSALPEQRINELMLNTLNSICFHLEAENNWKRYDIRKSDLDIIHEIIRNSCYSCLMRARDAGERSFLGKTTIETISNAPRGKKEGWLDKIRK